MPEPLHINKTHLPCNSENCKGRLLDKFTETLIDEHDDLRCLYCNNWLCGFYDAYGDVTNEKYCNRAD